MLLKRFLIFIMFCPSVFGINTAINAFNAGEFSPLVYGRTDLQKYYSGCQTLENMLVMTHGGATRRPGSKYIAEVKNSSKKVRLIPFEFSTDDAYILEFGNQYIRFFKDGEQILDGVGTDDLSGLDNLLAHWKLNEVDTTTAVNSDNPGTHDGTVSVDASTVTAEGKVGTAFDLDGQYDVTVADNDIFSFTDDSDDDPFSLVCWTYVTTDNDFQVLMSKWRDSSATSKPEWRLSLTQNRKVKLTLADSSANLESNRVAQWKLDEDAANTEVHDDTTAAAYPDPHDGVSTANTDTLDATGKLDGAFDFGGTEAVEVDDAADLSFGDGTDDDPFSIAAWVYVESGTSRQVILSKWNTNAREWRLNLEADEKVYFRIIDESKNTGPQVVTSALTDGWHFIVATYNGVGGGSAHLGMSIYIDSVLDSVTQTTTAQYVAMENTVTKVAIGADYSSGSLANFWKNKLDNIVLYDIELDQSDIDILWNDGSGTAVTSAVEVSTQTDSALDIGWHFITSTYSAPADETTAADGIIIYVDGAVVSSTATNSTSYTAMQNDAEEVRLGSQRNAADSADENFLAERLDEVSIFDDVLDATEVASLYSTTPLEIETTYLTADLFGIQYIQSADFMFLAHPNYPQRQLVRFSDTVWEIDDLVFERGPFLDENETAITITPSATTGTIDLLASDSLFNENQAGALLEISYDIVTENVTGAFGATGQSATQAVQLGRSWSFSTGGTWVGTVEIQKSYDSGTTWSTVAGQVYPGSARNVNASGTETVDDATYRVNMVAYTSGSLTYDFAANGFQLNGVVEISSVSDSTNATGVVKVDLGDTAATAIWSEGAWSDYRGYPGTLAFFEERLVFASTTYRPQTIWFSETNAWTSFRAGTDDSDSMTFTLAADKVNAIRWMSPRDSLIMGTSGGEWTIGSESADTGLTPTNPKAVRHSTYGSADLQAVAVNNVVLFPQREARKIRELTYSFELDNFVAPDMTVLSEHVTETGIVDMGYQSSPDSILWNVLTDGDIAAMTYNREQDVIGWHRHVTDGEYESIAVIPGTEDEVWVSVKRIIDNNIVRYVEQFQPRDYGDDQDDAFYVDSGFTYDGVATTTITGLDYLEGEVVKVLGDGLLQADKTVTGGEITITEASTVQVGMAYTSTVSPMPLNVPLQDGTMMGRTVIIRELNMRFNETSACNTGPTATKYSALVFDTVPYSGNKQITWKGSYATEGNIVMFTSDPLPLTVLSLMPTYEVGR